MPSPYQKNHWDNLMRWWYCKAPCMTRHDKRAQQCGLCGEHRPFCGDDLPGYIFMGMIVLAVMGFFAQLVGCA